MTVHMYRYFTQMTLVTLVRFEVTYFTKYTWEELGKIKLLLTSIRVSC